MNAVSHKHHYAPKFYTRRWVADHDGKLVAWFRPYRAVVERRRFPDEVGYQENLNRFDGLPARLRSWFEDVFLKHADDAAAKALDKLESRRINDLTADEVCGWARFLISTQCRHPDPFSELKLTVRRVWEHHLYNTREEYERLRPPSDTRSYVEFIASISEEEREKACVQLLKEAIDNKIVGDQLTHMDWAVLEFQKPPAPLLTSDWPVLFNLGANIPNVIMPIGPSKLFVAAKDKSLIEGMQKSPAERVISDVNRHSVRRARNFVFSDGYDHADFITAEMGCDRARAPFFSLPFRQKAGAALT